MTQAIDQLNEKLAKLDTLRGTKYWDSHQNNLWHSLYARLVTLQKEYYKCQQSK